MEAGDTAEARRWLAFVEEAHARGDYRHLHELSRREWCAVRHGRFLQVWSLPEIEMAYGRSGGTLESAADPERVAIHAAVIAANREGRIMYGPGGARTPFRSAADPLRDETPEEMSAALDAKLAVFATVAAINEKISASLERVAAKLSNGEAIYSSADTVSLLERTINEIAATPSGELGFPGARVRFTDESAFPKWGELLRTYADAWSKAGRGPNRAAELTRSLDATYTQEDQQAAALAEKVTGSPDPLPAELVNVARAAVPGLKVPRGVIEVDLR